MPLLLRSAVLSYMELLLIIFEDCQFFQIHYDWGKFNVFTCMINKLIVVFFLYFVHPVMYLGGSLIYANSEVQLMILNDLQYMQA